MKKLNKKAKDLQNLLLSWLYYFLVCASALPATDLLFLLLLPSLKILDAVVATLRLVCFLFANRHHPLQTNL